jgi:hypothetical protein
MNSQFLIAVDKLRNECKKKKKKKKQKSVPER